LGSFLDAHEVIFIFDTFLACNKTFQAADIFRDE